MWPGEVSRGKGRRGVALAGHLEGLFGVLAEPLAPDLLLDELYDGVDQAAPLGHAGALQGLQGAIGDI